MINRIKGGIIQNIEPGLAAIEELLDGSVLLSTSPEVQQSFAVNDTWISLKHQLRCHHLPVVPAQMISVFFAIVGPAPADDGTDLTSRESEAIWRRPAFGHTAKRLPIKGFQHPGFLPSDEL